MGSGAAAWRSVAVTAVAGGSGTERPWSGREDKFREGQ